VKFRSFSSVFIISHVSRPKTTHDLFLFTCRYSENRHSQKLVVIVYYHRTDNNVNRDRHSMVNITILVNDEIKYNASFTFLLTKTIFFKINFKNTSILMTTM